MFDEMSAKGTAEAKMRRNVMQYSMREEEHKRSCF
jgi:hypothetical protein